MACPYTWVPGHMVDVKNLRWQLESWRAKP